MSVPDEWLGFSGRSDNGMRHRAEEEVDDEKPRIEMAAFFRKLVRAAHVQNHADPPDSVPRDAGWT